MSNLSGVFLSITTFTFTTILTVLNIYNSSFSPRIVQDFINKPVVLNVLGIFIGGFFYTVLGLFMLREGFDDRRVISGTFGVFYAVFSMIYFIFFIQQVIRDVKSVNVTQDIYEQAQSLIEKEVEARKESMHRPRGNQEDIEVYAKDTGFLYGINYPQILSIMGDVKGELIIDSKVGESVTKGLRIARLHVEEGTFDNTDECKERLSQMSDCFMYSAEKNDREDYHHEISNLVEITVRAAGPGVNDPNTAIYTIQKISNLLGELFATKNQCITHDKDDFQIVYLTYSVEQELYFAFYQILHYSKLDPSIMQAILDGLNVIYIQASQTARGDVARFFGYVLEIAKDNAVHALDLQRVEMIERRFSDLQERSRNQELQ